MKINCLYINTLALFAAMHCLSANAQAPEWVWAVDSDGPQDERLYRVAAAPDGVVYALGDFKGPFTLGAASVDYPGNSGVSVGYPVLTKLTGAGEVEWTLPLFDPELQYWFLGVFGLAADSEGNAYVSGMVFRGPIVGSYSVTIAGQSFTVPASTNGDSFIAKIDPQGNAEWVRQTATEQNPGWATNHNIAVDDNDLIYWAGTFQMDNIEIDGTVHPKIGGPGTLFSDIFLAQLNSDGQFLWSGTMGSEGHEGGIRIAPAVGGGVLMSSFWTGEFVYVGGLTAVNPHPLISDNSDRWIAKINTAGEADWLVREGGLGNESIGLVNSTPSGGAVVVSAIANPITLNDVVYDDFGHLLTRYSSDGELESATHLSTGNLSDPFGTTDQNDTYFLGFNYSSSTFNFGGFQFTNSGASNGTSDMVMAAVDGAGTPLWAVSAGSADNDYIASMAFSPSQGLVVGANFSGSSLNLGDLALENNGLFTYDKFTAALDFITSVTNSPVSQALHLFPNPAQSQIAADLTALDGGQHTLRIFDTRGSLVLSQTVTGGALESIDVSEMPAGNYVLIIQTEASSYVSKFLKL